MINSKEEISSEIPSGVPSGTLSRVLVANLLRIHLEIPPAFAYTMLKSIPSRFPAGNPEKCLPEIFLMICPGILTDDF